MQRPMKNILLQYAVRQSALPMGELAALLFLPENLEDFYAVLPQMKSINKLDFWEKIIWN